MSSKTNSEKRILIKLANEQGIFLKEDTDDKFAYQITPDRHIKFIGSKSMSPENMDEMYRLADFGNMEYNNGDTKIEALMKCR